MITTSSAAPSRSGAVLAFIEQHWAAFATYAGSLLLAIAGAPSLLHADDPAHPSTASFEPGHWGGSQWQFALGALLTLGGVLRHITLRPSYGTLLSERNRSDVIAHDRATAVEAVLRAILNGLTGSLDLVAHTNRASVYCFEDSQFVLLSRVSLNSDWKKPGRASYPEGQGVIGKAWNETSSVVIDLPESRADWEVQVVDLGIPLDVVRTLRMQSRSLVGVRIDAHQGLERVPVGVLVIESTTPRGVNSKTIDKLEVDFTWQLLQDAMANPREHLPLIARSLIGAAG